MPNYVTNIITMNANKKQLQEIYETIKADDGELGSFDFNKLVPMPESLNVTKGSVTDKSINAYLSYMRNEFVLHPDRPGLPDEIKRYVSAAAQIRRHDMFFTTELMTPETIDVEAERHNMSTPDFLELGKKYLDNQLNFGAPTWYDWSIANWGTKWNVQEGIHMDEEDPRIMNFDTAWSAPLPIIEALSKRFPNVEITIQWADEDIGNNVGQQTYLDGEVTDENIPEPWSKEAYDLAFEIFGDTPEDRCLRYDAAQGTYVYDEELEQEQARVLEERLQEARERRLELSAGTERQEKEPER